VQAALGDAKVAIVTDHDKVLGIVTKIDLIDFLARQPTKSATIPPPVNGSAKKKNGAAKAKTTAVKAKAGAAKAKTVTAPKGKTKARARA